MFVAILYFFTVLVQAIFVTKYWVIGKTIYSIQHSKQDKYLAHKAYAIFTTIILLTSGSLIMIVRLKCATKESFQTMFSFVLNLVPMLILMGVLADALKTM